MLMLSLWKVKRDCAGRTKRGKGGGEESLGERVNLGKDGAMCIRLNHATTQHSKLTCPPSLPPSLIAHR
jgi:hypothetical protein